MTSAPVPIGTARPEGQLPALLRLRAFWGSLAIVAMWIAVIVVGVVAPDIESSGSAGSGASALPSVVPVALFAAVATIFVAYFAFREPERPDAS